MNKLFASCVACLLFFCTFAQKNTRVAYVDMEYILSNMPEYKAASEALSEKVRGWQDEIETQQSDIEYLKKQLEVETPLLTAELIADRKEEIALLEQNLREYQQKRFGADGDYITQRWTLVQPIQDQVFSLAQEIGKTRKYDYIFSKEDATAIFAAEKNDITKLVLRLLRRNENAQDRNKDIATLLKENLDVDYKDEKTLRREELKRQREAERAKIVAEREAQKRKVQQEREVRQHQREEQLKARVKKQ